MNEFYTGDLTEEEKKEWEEINNVLESLSNSRMEVITEDNFFGGDVFMARLNAESSHNYHKLKTKLILKKLMTGRAVVKNIDFLIASLEHILEFFNDVYDERKAENKANYYNSMDLADDLAPVLIFLKLLKERNIDVSKEIEDINKRSVTDFYSLSHDELNKES